MVLSILPVLLIFFFRVHGLVTPKLNSFFFFWERRRIQTEETIPLAFVCNSICYIIWSAAQNEISTRLLEY
jgi:hypothetical protein